MSIEMDLFVIFGRVFSNEFLERIMYMIVIWVGFLFLSLDNWFEYVNERIGIFYVWYVFVFVFVFSLVINVYRLLVIVSVRYKRFKLRKRIKM